MVKVKNVCYPVSDMERMVAFYQDALHLTPQFVDGDRWAQFKVGNTTFALSGGEETPEELKSGAVITFEVDNMTDVVSGLAERGISVSSIRDMGDHGRTCWFSDPSGNVIQLFER